MMSNLVRNISSKQRLFIALVVVIVFSTTAAALLNFELANVAIDAITRATESGYNYFIGDVSVLTDQKFPDNDSSAAKLTVVNNGMIIFDLDRVYALHSARLYVGENHGGYYIWAWLGGHRANDGGVRDPMGELVATVENYEFASNCWVDFPFPSNTYSDNVELNITSGADLYEFELYAENKRIYSPQQHCLPLDFIGTSLNTEMSINIDILDSLGNAEQATLEISAYDIDDTSEVEIYLNNNGPLWPSSNGIGHDTLVTFVKALNIQTLQMGENELRFVYANDFDGGVGGFRIEKAAITITYKILTGVHLSNFAAGVPLRFKLLQNYPNPFSDREGTIIKYALPVRSRVTLKIFNSVGQLVRTLVDEEKPAGVYHTFWNGRTNTGQQVSNGLYFYQLNAGNFVRTKKLIYLK